jgi:hypothetical protein
MGKGRAAGFSYSRGIFVRLLSEAECQNAASRRPGLSKNWTPATSNRQRRAKAGHVYCEDEPGLAL